MPVVRHNLVPRGTIDCSAGAQILPGSMLRLLSALVPALCSAIRSRRNLVLENLALRQQLAMLVSRQRPLIPVLLDPAAPPLERLGRDPPAIVQPNRVVHWHRAGLRIYWSWMSRHDERSGRPPLEREVRALIKEDSPLGRSVERRPGPPTWSAFPGSAGCTAWRRAA